MLVRDIDLMDAIADLFGKRQVMKGKTASHPVVTLDDCTRVAHARVTVQSSSANCMIQFNIAISTWFNPRLAKANCIQPGPEGPVSSFAVARDYLRRRFVLLSQDLTQRE